MHAHPTQPRPLPAHDLRDAMSSDHEDIIRLFDHTVAVFQSGDGAAAEAAFARFEMRLDAHLAFEDDVLLPSLRRAHPAEAAELAAEHHRIRGRLMELAVGLELHLTRPAWVADFVELLTRHAHREDALVYRWAGDPANVDARAALHHR